MATSKRQSQFCRLLSPGVFVTLILALGLALPLRAADEAAVVPSRAPEEASAPASNYQPSEGEEFFILSEKSAASTEIASVRLEVQRHSSLLEEHGGVDIALYRVPDPIAFLRAQTNLHRVKVPAKPQPEGLANVLKLSWDKLWANSRFAWKRIFSAKAREAATEAAPALKTPEDIYAKTRLSHPPAYTLLPGLTLVDRFRYPVQQAKPIVPPQNVKLEGSSSEFLPNNEGNVRIPLGKRAPGLYLVEASLGKRRALTLVFVADTVAVTKSAASEMLVWTADRKAGTPVARAEVFWSDGVGVLKNAQTGADGVVRLAAASPETSYVFGQDPAGGVFISENFYHDSEIYNAKIYAVTDRPLYRPGDLVQVKFLGREFKNARQSDPVTAGDIRFSVVDPAGTEVLTHRLRYDPATGADTRFLLPAAAQAGGWELVFSKGADTYGAAFRVADYVKPHFEINVVFDKPEFKTKEAVSGRVRLTYPDGKPVAGALVRLTARAQPLTLVEGELRYGGQIPLAIKADELKTGGDGSATFSLPASEDPARYILSLLAQDGAAYRVRSTQEVLVERGATLWQLAAPAYFSRPGEKVNFAFSPQGAVSGAESRPARWEILRLEDRSRRDGTVAGEAKTLDLDFPQAGSYTVSLRDAKGNLLAAASHWVSGEGMKAVPGTIEIVFDKESYQAGETAHALITFPQPVSDALLTLERDRVEAHGLLSGKAGWLSLSPVAPGQWKADIPVKSDYGPNVTFSVLTLSEGDYVFQNKGLRVAVPTVDIAIRPGRERYAPGEMVTLEIETRLGGKAAPALVNLGVVDEMIYVLQPEIAPAIGSFFYHPRRNNVRTAVSLSFIGYDLARLPAKGGAPVRRAPSERGVKVLERPRRDDTDTAGWWPSLSTGPEGKATVSFRMPDALTRWRITARAITPAGIVGQQTRHVESYKDFYAKWSGPAIFRQADQPVTTLIAFNQTGVDAKAQLLVSGGGLNVKQEVNLKPGANTLPLTIDKPVSGDVAVSLAQNGKEIDHLKQAIAVLPPGWLSERALPLEVSDGQTALTLPADARDIRVSLASGSAAQFARIADDLFGFPWGCVEQTASRLLPLSLAYRTLPADAPRVRDVAQSLATQRLRLVQMAGPEAIFSWWGPGTADSGWLTAYAYYADWHASRALGLSLPPEHWRQALEGYKKHAEKEPFALRTLAVWFLAEMDLPVRTLAEGLVREAAKPASKSATARSGSPWLGDIGEIDPLTLVLLGQLARQQQQSLPPALAQRIDAAKESLRAQPEALGQALLAMETKNTHSEDAARWLATLGPGTATLDRAIALAWWNKALGGFGPAAAPTLTPQGDWQAYGGPFGAPTWRWTGIAPPKTLTLSAAPATPLSAFIRYRSAEPEKAKLPVNVERRLYRLVAVPEKPKPAAPAGEARSAKPPVVASLAGEATEFRAELAKDSEIRSNELYLEEIRLTAQGGAAPRFGLLEVPLPPGADVERGTWGIYLRGLDEPAKRKDAGNKEASETLLMDKARSQPGELSYAVPVDDLSEGRVIRHLLRFGSRGSFVLPPARFHRMYQPEEKAFEAVSERRVKVQ